MTADEARGRIGEIRVELRCAMRHLSGPRPDWLAASRELLLIEYEARLLSEDCHKEWEAGRVAYGPGYYLEKIAEDVQAVLDAFGVGQEDKEVDHGDR